MTHVFKLNSPELKQIIDHTLRYPECRVAYTKDKTAQPDLFLVKDGGCYLMTASDKSLPKNPQAKQGDKDFNHQVVCYAEGARPEDGWIGGDDYAENLPVAWFTEAIKAGKKLAIITVTDEIKFESA
jgi:hypothetical protein